MQQRSMRIALWYILFLLASKKSYLLKLGNQPERITYALTILPFILKRFFEYILEKLILTQG